MTVSNDQPNVLVDKIGHARLTDFGFTSVVRGVDSVLVTKVQGYTPRWAAPEVLASGDRNTREADIFAFGMVVIEVGLCTRTAPGVGSDAATFDIRVTFRRLPESYHSASLGPW